MEVMMMLGPFIFGLNTAAFQELNRNTEWRWPGQELFGGKQALQFTGWGDDSITLPGVIFPEYWGGTEQVNELRTLGDSGMPQLLLDGRGNVLGDFVITGVQERQSTFGPAGVALRQEFTLHLKRYDGPGAPVATSKVASTPVPQVSTAVAVAPPTGVAGLASTVSSAAATAGAAVTALDAIRTASSGLQAVSGAVGVALTNARALQAAARDSMAAVNALGGVASYSTALSAVNGLLRTAGTTAAAATKASAMVQSAGGAASALLQVNKLAASATAIRADVLGALGRL